MATVAEEEGTGPRKMAGSESDVHPTMASFVSGTQPHLQPTTSAPIASPVADESEFDDNEQEDPDSPKVSWIIQQNDEETIPVREIYRAFKYMNRTNELKNLFVYMIFFAIYLYVIVTLFRVEPVYSMTRALEDVFLDEEFVTVVDGESQGPYFKKNFYDIFSFDEYFQWVNGPLLNGILNNEYYNGQEYAAESRYNIPGGFGGNRILSPIRFRTARVRNGTKACQTFGETALPNWTKPVKNCFPPYTDEDRQTGEWREPFVFNPEFKSRVRGVDGYGTSFFSNGYGESGYMYELHLHHPNGTTLTVEEAREKVQRDLMDNFWADFGTRLLVVDFNVINFNLGNGMSVRFACEIAAGGGFHNYYRMYQVLLNSVSNEAQRWRMFWQVVFTIFLVYYWIEFINDIRRQQRPLAYLFATSWWTFVDFCNLILSLIVTVWMYVGQFNLFTDELTAKITQRNGASGFTDMFEEARILSYISYLASANVAFGFLKMFKYLRVYRRLTIMWDALAEALPEVVTLAIAYIILSGSFAIAGHILFGLWTEEFHSLSASLSTVLRSIMGDFNYTAIRNAEPTWAPVYYVLFVFLEFFVLLNMFIAVVSEYYEVAKRKLRENKLDTESDNYLIVQSIISVRWRQIKMRLLHAYEQETIDKCFNTLCFGTNHDERETENSQSSRDLTQHTSGRSSNTVLSFMGFGHKDNSKSTSRLPRDVFEACPSNWTVVEFSPGVTRRDRQEWMAHRAEKPGIILKMRLSKRNPWRTLWWWAVHHIAKRQRILAIGKESQKLSRQKIFKSEVSETKMYLNKLARAKFQSSFLPTWDSVLSKGDIKKKRRSFQDKAKKDRVRLLINEILWRAVDRHARIHSQDLFLLFDNCWDRMTKLQRDKRLDRKDVAVLLGVTQPKPTNGSKQTHQQASNVQHPIETPSNEREGDNVEQDNVPLLEGDAPRKENSNSKQTLRHASTVQHPVETPLNEREGVDVEQGNAPLPEGDAQGKEKEESKERSGCFARWHKKYRRLLTTTYRYEYVEGNEMQDVIDLIKFTAELHDLHPTKAKAPTRDEIVRRNIDDISSRLCRMENVLNELAVSYRRQVNSATVEEKFKQLHYLQEQQKTQSEGE